MTHALPGSAAVGAPARTPRVTTSWRYDVARRARRGLENLMRFGHFTRGLVYMIPGLFALGLATGSHGAALTQTRAIQLVAERPFGRVLVSIVAIGLAGYALWGLVRAILDPLGRGRSLMGWLSRFGFLTSAIAYSSLLVFALRVAAGGHPPTATRDWAHLVLAHPFGAWVLGIAGLCWIGGGGIGQIVAAWRGTFRRDLDLPRMGRREHDWAVALGRIGIAARGVVFLTIGAALVAAAMNMDLGEPNDLAGALLELLHQPFGHPLVLGVAIGLIVFGVFSMLCVRWARVRVAREATRAALSLHPEGPS